MRAQKTQHLSVNAANFNAKLAEKYDGPYVVKQKLSPVIVDLQDDRGKYQRNIHISKLKPYHEPVNMAGRHLHSKGRSAIHG